MFTSITETTEFQPLEQTPTSPPPWVWPGLLYAFASFVIEVVFLIMVYGEAPSLENDRLAILVGLLGMPGVIYWMFCVHRIHKTLAQMTYGRYPISPLGAALKHLIPFYNLYWVFHWPGQFSDYLNRRRRVTIISGSVIGVMLLLSMFVYRFIDGPVGLAGLFGMTMFISSKLKAHIKTMKGITPDQLPPLPDPRIFSQPIETSTSLAQGPVEDSGAR